MRNVEYENSGELLLHQASTGTPQWFLVRLAIRAVAVTALRRVGSVPLPQGAGLRALSGGCFPVGNLEKDSKEANHSHVATKQTEPPGNFMSSRPAFEICEKKKTNPR